VSLLSAILVLLVLALGCGVVLSQLARKFGADEPALVDRIDALLPQTQCGQCGHPGCRPYATAIAEGEAINRCPPGGDATIRSLARLLGQAPLPLDPTHGKEDVRKVAYIRENECIGCTKCVKACPVDAILGAAKHMHTVITSECTGCDLCVAPCPVDCIDMIPLKNEHQRWHWPRPDAAEARHQLIASDRLHEARA